MSRNGPPFLLIHGTSDSLVPFEQSARFSAAMRAAGEHCEVYPVNGGGHGVRWWEYEHLTAYKAFMLRWLATQLNTTPAAHT